MERQDSVTDNPSGNSEDSHSELQPGKSTGELYEIEKKILEAYRQRHSWAVCADLINQVDKSCLYYKSGYASFTEWVNNFSERIGCSKSTLWKWITSGRFYTEYAEAVKYRDLKEKNVANEKIPELKDLKIPVDSLQLVEKISRGNLEETGRLMEMVQSGTLTQGDLKQIWGSVRARSSREENRYGIPQGVEDSAKSFIIELQNPDWIYRFWKMSTGNDFSQGRRRRRDIQPKYRCLTDFNLLGRPENGDYNYYTYKLVHADAVIAENLYVEQRDDFNFHGIYIISSKEELSVISKDERYFLYYTQFVDYLWLYVSEELLKAVKNTVPDYCGILVYTGEEPVKEKGETQSLMYSRRNKKRESHIRIERPAKRCDGRYRTQTALRVLKRCI